MIITIIMIIIMMVIFFLRDIHIRSTCIQDALFVGTNRKCKTAGPIIGQLITRAGRGKRERREKGEAKKKRRQRKRRGKQDERRATKQFKTSAVSCSSSE
jgi:hypothetical protein